MLTLIPEIVPGTVPWEPAPYTSSLEVWHYHDMTLGGTFRLEHDELVFFWAIDGPSDDGRWFYARIDDDQEAQLHQAAERSGQSGEAFYDVIEPIIKGWTVVIALADDLRLTRFREVTISDDVISEAMRIFPMPHDN